MLSEDDKAEMRRIARETYADLHGLPDNQFEFSETPLPEPSEPWIWDCCRRVKDWVLCIARSPGGGIVRVCFRLASAVSTAFFINDYLIRPAEAQTPAVIQSINDWVSEDRTPHFDLSKKRYLVVTGGHQTDLWFVPEASGVVETEIFDTGVPIARIINNSMGVSTRVATQVIHQQRPQIIVNRAPLPPQTS